jgi:hypothetical protein
LAIDAGIDARTTANVGATLQLTTDPGNSTEPMILPNGTGYAAVWRDTRDGSAEEIYFVLLDSEGQKVAPELNISNTIDESDDPSLAIGVGGFGVSWTEGVDVDREIQFALLDPTGTPTQIVPITAALGASGFSTTVWTGTDYAIVWDDDRGGDRQLYFARVDTSGTIVQTPILISPLGSSSRHPVALATSTGLALLWQDFRNTDSEIYYGLFDTSGAIQGSDVNLSMSGNPPSRFAHVAKSGDNLVAVFEDDRQLPRDPYLLVFDESGTGQTPPLRLLNDDRGTTRPIVAYNGSEYGIIWKEGGTDDGHVLFALATENEVLQVETISTEIDAEAPWIIADGEGFVVVWKDERTGNSDIYLARIDVAR